MTNAARPYLTVDRRALLPEPLFLGDVSIVNIGNLHNNVVFTKRNVANVRIRFRLIDSNNPDDE